MSVEEYTREFEQLLIKCDLKEDEEQTLVRYLGGLDERISNVVELHPYTTLDELSSLSHKVELQKRVKGKSEAQTTHSAIPPSKAYLQHSKVTKPLKTTSTPTSQNSPTTESYSKTQGDLKMFLLSRIWPYSIRMTQQESDHLSRLSSLC